MRKICRSRILLPAVLILGGVFLAAAPAGAGEDKSYAVRGSYSLLEDFSLEGDYRFDPSFYLNFSFLDKHWRLQAKYLPVPALALKAGYDATDGKYLAGLEHQWRLGENIMLLSEVTGFKPREGDEYSLDYQSRFRIGIGGDNLVYAGIKGDYIPEVEHDPEFFVQLDLNWYFRHGWRLRFEPYIMVEGDFHHRISLDRKWDNGIKGGIFIGQNEEYYWDAGLFINL